MDFIHGIYMFLGSLICHQLSGRSLSIQGYQLPMCARDTGIYLGIFVALAYIFMRRRFGANGFPKLSLAIGLCFLMLPMLADGIGSFIGLIDSNNTIRLLTGLLFGSALPLFLIPAAHFSVEGNNTLWVIKRFRELVFIVIVDVFLALVLVKGILLPWIVISSGMLFSFVFIIARIIYTLILRMGVVQWKYLVLCTTGSTLAVLLLMHMASNYLLRPLKNYF